eukprot:m.57490 g.57490  ORF g.57490 m.57490 type:complete len:54 (+) comp34748_c0_seq3:887-1048(+)
MPLHGIKIERKICTRNDYFDDDSLHGEIPCGNILTWLTWTSICSLLSNDSFGT